MLVGTEWSQANGYRAPIEFRVHASQQAETHCGEFTGQKYTDLSFVPADECVMASLYYKVEPAVEWSPGIAPKVCRAPPTY